MTAEIMLPIADLHVGSKLGLLHPDTPGVKQNAWQKYTWKCWKHMLSLLPDHLDVVVFMDEVLDGPADKNHKYLTCITKPLDQRNAARLVIQELVDRADESWFNIGSDWHVGAYGAETLTLAELVGANVWDNGEHAGQNLLWKRGDVVLDFAHPRSVVEVNRSMPLEKEMRYRLADNPLPKGMKASIQCIVRAHAHQFGIWQDRHGISMGVPAWQGTYWGYGIGKRSPARIFTDIGWLTIGVDPDARHPVWVDDWELYESITRAVSVWDREKREWTSPSSTSR